MRATLGSMNEAMRTLLREAEAYDGFPAVSDQAQLEARTGKREVVTIGSDPLDAVGIVGGGEIDLVVRPEARGQGIASSLCDELLDAAPDGDLRAWVHGDNAAAELLLERHGFVPARTLLRLELPGDELSDTPDPMFADHITVVTFDPSDRAQATALIEVNALAFASHPEQGQLTLEAFLETMREDWFDPNDVLLAYEGDHLLAFAWIKTTQSVLGETETELYVIGVHPDATGRGLGTAMLRKTLNRMRDHSPTRVTLYVEGDNDAALALYRNAKFTVALRSQQWFRSSAE